VILLAVILIRRQHWRIQSQFRQDLPLIFATLHDTMKGAVNAFAASAGPHP